MNTPFYGEGAAFRDMAGQIRRGYDVECSSCGKFCDTGCGPCEVPFQLHDYGSRGCSEATGELIAKRHLGVL